MMCHMPGAGLRYSPKGCVAIKAKSGTPNIEASQSNRHFCIYGYAKWGRKIIRPWRDSMRSQGCNLRMRH
eukprot:scaffold105643_cov32-Tisochrysis_lutea.AAC.4